MKKYIFFLCALIVILGTVEEAFGVSLKELRDRGIPEVTDKELFHQFMIDEASATQKYIGKDVVVTGTVEMTGTTSTGIPYVIFKIHDDKKSIVVSYFTYYKGNDSNKILQLQQGQTLTVHGMVEQKAYNGGITGIIILYCEIIQAENDHISPKNTDRQYKNTDRQYNGIEEVTIKEVIDYFYKSPVAFIARYALKGMIISGNASSIVSDSWGPPYISFDTDLSAIACYFNSPRDAAKVAQIKEGQYVTMHCYPMVRPDLDTDAVIIPLGWCTLLEK